MKLKSIIQTAAPGLALLSTLNLQPLTALAQGSLTPPGPPGATMLTLSQIEPRQPIAAAPFTITQPGSYYLTTNLTVSSGSGPPITIAASGVTLDLNGFTISSTAASATGWGILINSGLRSISIANGFIQGSVTNNGSGVYSGGGLGYGIDYSGSPPVNVLVSRVSVSGCLIHGIYLNIGDSTVVESCTVRTVGAYGIFASTIKQSSAIDCGNTAIYGDQVSDSRGQSSGGGSGVTSAATALNCYGYSSGSGDGVAAYAAQNCLGYSIGDGVGVSTLTAQNCIGDGEGNGVGVAAYTALNCYGFNSGSGYGIKADQVANGCYGYSPNGIAVYAFIASVCHGETSAGTALVTAYNVNSY